MLLALLIHLASTPVLIELPQLDTRVAIGRLAPHLPRATVRRYAKIIRVEAAARRIDPLLVVSFIHVETGRKWDPRLRSPTNDYGLTQVHVSARGSERFLGREHELFDPRTNIREWCRLAMMWRSYHCRECEVHAEICYGGPDGPWGCSVEVVAHFKHPWWAHLQWGYRVKGTSHAEKVLRLYRQLGGKGLRDADQENWRTDV